MKIKVLLLLAGLGLTLMMDLNACPVRYLGKIKIVDENFNELDSAKLYRFSYEEDSFLMKKSTRYHWYGNDTSERPDYLFYNRNYWFLDETKSVAEYRYKVSSKGYADLYLKDINFFYSRWKDSVWIYPVLYIVMPKKKFVKAGNTTTRVSSFKVDYSFRVKDTAIFNLLEKEFVNLTFPDEINFQEELNTMLSAQNKSMDIETKTYPNPIKGNFHVEIPNIYELGQKVTFYSLAGQEVKSFILHKPLNTIETDWLTSGTYFFIIYDENGNGIHKERLVKL